MNTATQSTTVQRKNLLVAVTGESPAVVTETVFGLYKERNILIDHIVVITTTRGADQARLQLLVGDEGKPRPLDQLCRDFQLPPIRFSEQDILIVPGENGLDVDDARSEGDQRALADFITRTVRKFTEDSQVRVIASLAGGRKTMTFFWAMRCRCSAVLTTCSRTCWSASLTSWSEGFITPRRIR
jgi:CRISPR-associated protein (TIGR02584 family)